jgi:POT family proton-dependent oligopeptide transporter
VVLLRVGHIILVGSSVPSALVHPNGALTGLIVAIIIMGVGAGCIKANVSPMVAEQYTGKLRKKTLASGEVVLISPALTYQRIYMCKHLDPGSFFQRCNLFES